MIFFVVVVNTLKFHTKPRVNACVLRVYLVGFTHPGTLQAGSSNLCLQEGCSGCLDGLLGATELGSGLEY